MAIFSDSQLTAKGHALLSKVLAGRTEFVFSKFKAGDGYFDFETQEVLDLTKLVNFRLDGRVVGVHERGTFTEVECVLTNEHLTEFMEFREIGLMANDPDEGEILFAYANAGDFASPIGPFNGAWLHEEIFTMRVYTANATNIKAEITPTAFATEIRYSNLSSGLKATNVQQAIDELLVKINEVSAIITINPEEPIPTDGTAGTGTVTQLLGRLSHMIKLITGNTLWYLAPHPNMKEMAGQLKQIAYDTDQNVLTSGFLGASFLGASYFGATASLQTS